MRKVLIERIQRLDDNETSVGEVEKSGGDVEFVINKTGLNEYKIAVIVAGIVNDPRGTGFNKEHAVVTVFKVQGEKSDMVRFPGKEKELLMTLVRDSYAHMRVIANADFQSSIMGNLMHPYLDDKRIASMTTQAIKNYFDR